MTDHTPLKQTLHRDGTVTYWSVYQQRWIKRASMVPDRELAAMGGNDRLEAMLHIAKTEGS